MRYRCAILDDYQNVSLKFADWTVLEPGVGVTVFNQAFASSAEAIAALKDFDIVCAMRERTAFSRSVIEALPKLKLLITPSARNASFDLVAAKEHGITVCGTRNYGNPTASLAIALMLELTRKIGFENARMHAGAPWQVTMGEDIEGKTLGIIGLGKLGAYVASIAKALGMNVIAWSENLTPDKCAEAGVAYATKDELFAKSDIISIHLVLSDRSRGLVGASDIARMKPTAYLVNTSRGPIIDEAALVAALQNRTIAGAGLDTFWTEPLRVDHPLRKLDNAVLTPHLGYVTEGNYRQWYGDMIENIQAWLDGKPVRVMTP